MGAKKRRPKQTKQAALLSAVTSSWALFFFFSLAADTAAQLAGRTAGVAVRKPASSRN